MTQQRHGITVPIPFPDVAAASARGEVVAVISGQRGVAVHRSGARISFDLSFRAETPIELHAHHASMIVIPVEISAIETVAHLPRFDGSVQVSASGDPSVEVVLEGSFEKPVGRAAHLVPSEEILAAILDDLENRIEDHVVAVTASNGIPL